ncbi:MAG: hypothetical protein KGS45_09490 [Planctomycetes bacterium]|nr:hypothetical protein [Planctomycetota bacterium]
MKLNLALSAVGLVAFATLLGGCNANQKAAGACCNDKGTCTDKSACAAGKEAKNCDGSDCKPIAPGTKVDTVNTMCVMMPNEAISAGVTTDYKGMKVGFCCPGCITKFNKMSDADKVAQLGKVGVKVTN